MDQIAMCVGYLVIAFAFLTLIFWLLCGVGYLICLTWEAFSEEFRSICRAESLILEYKKYQKEFQRWFEGRNHGY